jgi:hypothetical protein
MTIVKEVSSTLLQSFFYTPFLVYTKRTCCFITIFFGSIDQAYCADGGQLGGEPGLLLQLPWLPPPRHQLAQLGRRLAALPFLRPPAQLRHHSGHQVRFYYTVAITQTS